MYDDGFETDYQGTTEDYQCERCSPDLHPGLNKGQRLSEIQKRSQDEGRVMTYCADILWYCYCQLHNEETAKRAVRAATELNSVTAEPVNHEPIKFTDSWKEGMYMVLRRCDDRQLEQLVRNFSDSMDQETRRLRPTPALAKLKGLVDDLKKAGEITSHCDELGVLAEVLDYKEKGETWNGL